MANAKRMGWRCAAVTVQANLLAEHCAPCYGLNFQPYAMPSSLYVTIKLGASNSKLAIEVNHLRFLNRNGSQPNQEQQSRTSNQNVLANASELSMNSVTNDANNACSGGPS